MDKMTLLIDKINNSKPIDLKKENIIKKLMITLIYSVILAIIFYFLFSFVMFDFNMKNWVIDLRVIYVMFVSIPFIILLINELTRSVVMINREKLKQELIDLYELGIYVATVKERFVEQDDTKMRDEYAKTKYFSFDRLVSYFIKRLG